MYKTKLIALALFTALFTTCTLGDDAETLHKEVKDSSVKIHKVTFNINGGSGAIPAEQTVKDGSAITLPNGNGFTRNGYTFGGWNTNANATGTNYNAGSLYKPAGNITLYARWARIQYTVTYNVNGGLGATPAVQTVDAGGSVYLANGSGLSRSGYTFGGWNTNSNGTGINYNSGSNYTPTGNITLYARWARIQYTVTYNINGGSGITPAVQTVDAGSGVYLASGSGFSRNGYTFGGWNTNSSGTGTNYYADSWYTPTGNVFLYAKWDIISLVPGANLAAKLTWLQTNAVTGGDYTVEVNANESISPQNLSYSGRNNIKITLMGIGSARTITVSSNGSMFQIYSGVTLVLDNNITLQGRNNNNSSLINVRNAGTLIMNAGSSITGNSKNVQEQSMGGGVYIESNGNFTMNGGTIAANNCIGTDGNSWAGGVYIASNGNFAMYGGTISNNTVNNHGGGVLVDGGFFSMSGGTISGNTAGWGGGVGVVGTFYMSGGTVTGNTARSRGGGLFVTAWSGGRIGILNKTGGTITGYGTDGFNGNVVRNTSNNVVVVNPGHAVYATNEAGTVVKRKENTAGSTNNLSFNAGNVSYSGGWDY